MTSEDGAGSFGPYAYTLAPAEAEAAAARFGLRVALRGGLLVRHLAPLAVFGLVLLFASILALTGFISRRAGEATLIVAAAAFMIQRLSTHWRVWRARTAGRTAMAQLQAWGGLFVVLGKDSVTVASGSRLRRLAYRDIAEAEDAGGLIYLWPRSGAPIVVPARALAEGEAARLLARVRQRMREARS